MNAKMRDVAAIVRITRPANAALMGVAVIVGFILSHGSMTMLPQMVSGAAAASLLIALANTTNDIVDADVDKINSPTRPIPSGKVNIVEARSLSLIIFFLGLLASFLTFNLLYVLMALEASALSILYNVYLKKTGLVGNVLVSALVALPFVAGGAIATSHLPAYLLLFSVMAFLTNLGREVHKGVIDVKGDLLKGIETPAVKYGEAPAKGLAAFFYVMAIVCTLLPAVAGITNRYYVYAIMIPDIIILISTLKTLTTDDKRTLIKMKDLIRVAMMLGMLSFVLGSL